MQHGTSTVTLGYDNADRRTSLTLPNTNSVTYAYNAASELTSLTYKKGVTVLGDLTYTYDLTGNRIKTGGSFARATIPPALTTVSYNANNQQTTFGTNTETYDLNGNLNTVTDAGVTATYTWNARNQLAGISTTGFAASFAYDSFGRRTDRTVQGVVTNYVYDGLNPVQEKAGATVTANLLTGLGIDEFFTRTDGVGTRALLPDALGSTVALGDNTGTLQTQYTYEPFGYATQTGQANTNSYKYTRREDDGSGLYYYRARYYHPRLQRFIAEDPIGFGGGMNFYDYVTANPMNRIDPLGLTSLVFDPGSGTLLIDPEVKGRSPYAIPASTGKPNCGCDASDPNRGPIPSGNYFIDTTKLSQLGFWQTLKRNRPFGGGGDWGNWNAPLTPTATTNTFGRGGFYIHGGVLPGSAGCIDVGGGLFGNDMTRQLLRDIMADPDKNVPVTVR